MIVETFLNWVSSAPVASRAEAANALGRAYLHSDLTPAERDGFEAAMTVLLDDPSPLVRAGLAEAVAAAAETPRHIVLTLAADQPEIAALVVTRSPILIDAELVDLVATAEPSVQAAVGSRPGLSAPVAAAICEVGEPEAAVALLMNPTAAVPVFSLKRLAERLGRDVGVRMALLERPGLPLAIRQILVVELSGALAAFVTERAWLGADRAAAVTREASDKATIGLAAGGTADEMRGFVEHLRVSGQLTTKLILRAVSCGNIRFFEEALAALSGLGAARVAALVADGREASLEALCRKARLPERSVPAFRAALETHRELAAEGVTADGWRFARRMMERVLTRYQDFEKPELDDLLAMLRRFAAEAAREAARDYAAEARKGALVAA